MYKVFQFLLVVVCCLGPLAQGLPVSGQRLMVSAPNSYAVDTAKRIAARGGNVVDVAVAMGLTLSVTAPYYAALGGGGFALVKVGKNEVQAIDFRETAPSGTSRDYYKNLPDKSSIDGAHAVGVPGFPSGLWALHKKYGKLKWGALFDDAIKLSGTGFEVSGDWVNKAKEQHDRFNPSGLKHFFKGNELLKPGDRLIQKDLAQALRTFRDKNIKGFYQGPVARDLIATLKDGGSSMTLEDLKSYNVRWLKPLATHFEGHTIYLMPPPSSGGVVIATALNLIDRLKLKNVANLSVDEFHLLAEIESRSFRGRALLGDPDFYKNPIAELLSEKMITTLAKSIDSKKSTMLPALTEKDVQPEKNETTHFSVLDSDGNAVALTVTLNGAYGSGVVSNRYGIALNNEMDDFTTLPGQANMYGLVQGEGNVVAPGKRPLSSMSPTLVEKDDQIVMAVGAPGGPRIISGVLQVLYRTLDKGWDVDKSVQAPRVHHQFAPNIVYVDKDRFSPDVLKALEARGHKVEESWMGKVYVVKRSPEGVLDAAYDSRGEGSAGGL